MKEPLERLQEEMAERITHSASEEEVERLRIEYLGRSGKVTLLFRSLREVSPEERPQWGAELNRLRDQCEEQIGARLKELKGKTKKRRLEEGSVDITLPGSRWVRGSIHPITQVMDEIIDAFLGMGFEIARGPDVEDDYHNFEALNIPKDHPARDMQDTFFVSQDRLLRTHTSPVQIHVMESRKPPLQVIAPGAVYRHDDDSTHSPMFHQVEGFMVDRHIAFADLKGVLSSFLRQMFHEKTGIRFRPSFFPFTEPSAEVDIECLICGGRGSTASGSSCRVCKGSGWLEILGSGMIDPQVFRFVGYDPEKFSGFAFGMGVERIAMLKFGIDDIRLFFQNDMRFLRQFG